MNAKQTAVEAVAATGVGAAIIGAFTTTPEIITWVIAGTEAFLAAGIVALILLNTRWLKSQPAGRQRRAIWVAAGSTGLFICALPLIERLVTRFA